VLPTRAIRPRDAAQNEHTVPRLVNGARAASHRGLPKFMTMSITDDKGFRLDGMGLRPDTTVTKEGWSRINTTVAEPVAVYRRGP
jgi:hypothetical protein